MKAAQFQCRPWLTMKINGSWLAVLVKRCRTRHLGITLLVSMLDARLQARTSLLASSGGSKPGAGPAGAAGYADAPANRILLENRLDQAINKAEPWQAHFALMFMDLDGFKTVNDAYRHDVGDKLLVAVTQRLLLPLKGQFTLAPYWR